MNQEESNLIAKAKLFAHNAHDSINQRRKYTDQPYWVHTDAVADTVAAYGGTATMVAAANLHDVLEDVSSITKVELEDEFPLDDVREDGGGVEVGVEADVAEQVERTVEEGEEAE